MKKIKLLLLVAGILLTIPAPGKNIPLWWNVSPSDGSTVDELSVLKIDNGSYSDTFRAEEGASLIINGSDVAYTVSYESNNGYPDDTIVLTLVDPITASGTYNINVPAGFFTYMYYGTDLSVSSEFEWSVSVKGNDGNNDDDTGSASFEVSLPSGFTVNPANGASVSSIATLKISDSTMEYESFSAKKSSFDIIINEKSTAVTASTTDTSITLTLTEPVSAEGTYNIEVPAGVFTYDDWYWDTHENQVFRWIVTVTSGGTEEPDNPAVPVEPENTTIPAGFKVTPEDGANVEELTVITVTNSVLGEFEFVDGSQLYINGMAVEFSASVSGYDDETLTLTLSEPITLDGTYSIFLPAGFFYYYGDIESDDFKWTVKIGDSGSEDPEPDPVPEATIPASFKVTPDNGATVEKLEAIIVESTRLGEIAVVEGSLLHINGDSVAYTATVSGSDDEILTLTLAEPLTVAGSYQINLPAGFFTFYDETFESDEFIWTVNIGGEVIPVDPTPEVNLPGGFSVTPASGTTVIELSEITISDASYEYDSFKVSANTFNILIDGNECVVTASADDTSVTMTLATPVTSAGTHTIEIPAGLFSYEDMFWETMQNSVFKWYVVVKEEEPGPEVPEDPEMPEDNVIPANFSVSPEDGETVKELSVITIEATRWAEIETVAGARLYIDGESVEYTAEVDGEDNEYLILTLAAPVEEDGEHTVFVPKGFFIYYEDLTSEAFKWNVIVDSAFDPENPEQPVDPIPGETFIPEGFNVSPEPDSEVESISKITITTDYSEIYLPTPLTSVLVNEAATPVTASANWDTLTITLDDEITEPGEYTFVIPARSFKWADITYEDSEVFVFTLTVKNGVGVGVDEINSDEEGVEIYTLGGIRVRDMEDGEVYILKKGDSVCKAVKK